MAGVEINGNTVVISYNMLEECKRSVRQMSNFMFEYSSKINSELNIPLARLLDDDDEGHIRNILDSIKNKRAQLEIKEDDLQKLYKAIDDFIDYAKRADGYVADGMKEVTKPITDNMGLMDSLASNIYNVFCVDLVNACPPARILADVQKTRWTEDRIKVENTIRWFEHGDGQYVMNIAEAISGVVLDALVFVGAIKAAVAAIAGIATIATVGAALGVAILVVGAVAATVVLACSIADGMYKCNSNGKALASDDPAESRYYGSIEGFATYNQKHDMGSLAENKRQEQWSNAFEGIKTTAEVTSFFTNILSLGVSTAKGGEVIGFSTDTLKNNLLKQFGYNSQTGKYNPFKIELLDSKAKNAYLSKSILYGSAKGPVNMTQNILHKIHIGAAGTDAFIKSAKYIDNMKTSFSNMPNDILSRIETISNSVINTSFALDFIPIFNASNTFILGLPKTTKAI